MFLRIVGTSVDFRRTTWRYIPEDITLHTSRRSPHNQDIVWCLSALFRNHKECNLFYILEIIK
jgi:hypothetical protein